jgi:hypothetical protein
MAPPRKPVYVGLDQTRLSMVRLPGLSIGAWRPPAFSMSQVVAPAPFKVSVSDARGNPFPGVRIEISAAGGGKISGTTDASGIAAFPSLPPGDFEAVFYYDGMSLRRKGRSDETLFVEIPVCAPAPLLTKTEIASLAAGSLLAGAGFLWKLEVLTVVGEVVFGAAAFTAIYRHSCNW